MKDIYLIMSHSGTIVSKAIKLYTRATYTHISIGFEEDLKSFYSFGRKKPTSPIGGGFVQESINQGIYALCKNTQLKIYKLSIDDEKYYNLKESLEQFITHKDKYKYNYIGIVTIMFGIKFKRRDYYFCSQFISELLQKNKICEFKKDFTLIRPKDFEIIQNKQLIYEGKMRDYPGILDKLKHELNYIN